MVRGSEAAARRRGCTGNDRSPGYRRFQQRAGASRAPWFSGDLSSLLRRGSIGNRLGWTGNI